MTMCDRRATCRAFAVGSASCRTSGGISSVKFDGLRSPIDQVRLEVAPIEGLVGFYRMGFPLPVLSAWVTDGLRRGAGNFYVSGEADSYDSQTCTDLERLAVLHLSDDQGALFGKSWSKKETKA